MFFLITEKLLYSTNLKHTEHSSTRGKTKIIKDYTFTNIKMRVIGKAILRNTSNIRVQRIYYELHIL